MDYLSPKYDLTDFHYFRKQRYVVESIPKCREYALAKIYPDGGIEELQSNESNGDVIPNVVYIGHFDTTHFGLWLVDYVSRLWKSYDQTKYQWIYTSSRDIKQYAYIIELLELAGVKFNRLRRVTGEAVFRNVIVPEQSFLHGESVSIAFRTLYAHMYLNLPISHCDKYEKIYLTRTKLNRKKEIGEWRFEHFFEANGYKIVALETYPIAQQAYLIRHAKNIVSLEGTHAHSIVWREACTEGRQIILRKQSEVIPRQMMLNQLWEIPLTYIDVFEEPYKGFPISHDRGPFLLKWTDEIESFARENNMIIPKECRRGYWRDKIEYIIKCFAYRIWHTLKHTFH